MHFPDLDAWEYYDLEADPDELQNGFGEPGNAASIAALGVMLGELRAQYGDTDE